MKRQQPARVAQLFGATTIILENAMTQLLPPDQIAYDTHSAALRAQLPAADFDATWAAGRRMTMDEAVQLALESR
jgi:hypothetical protein